MADRPYIAQAWEVLAFLADRKTRISVPVRPQPPTSYDDGRILLLPFQYVGYDPDYPDAVEYHLWRTDLRHGHGLRHCVRCPFGRPGDRLWVQETWACLGSIGAESQALITYRADGELSEQSLVRRKRVIGKYPEVARKWRPSIHMPRSFSRITLEVTDVKVKRVGEITEQDARAEGLADEYDDWREEVSNVAPPGSSFDTCRDFFVRRWNTRWAKKGYPFEENVWAWIGTVRRKEESHG